jgi:uncharacterized protein YndB with AHSA1/START domain
MRKAGVLICFIFVVAGSMTATAGIVDSSFYGFTISHEVTIKANPDSVYYCIVHDIGKWWDPDHTYSGNAYNLSIKTSADGCFCEKLSGGGTVRHMTVVFADPGKMLRMSGGIGPLQAMAVTGTMTFVLKKTDAGTNLKVQYTVGGYYPTGLTKVAGMVDKVLGQQVQRLKSYTESPGNPDATQKPAPKK